MLCPGFQPRGWQSSHSVADGETLATVESVVWEFTSRTEWDSDLNCAYHFMLAEPKDRISEEQREWQIGRSPVGV